MTSTLLTTENEPMAKALVREYFDNGLDVYDACRKRLGSVLDVDRPGGGFVVKLTHPEVCLFIPLQLVAKVKRRRVYLSEITRNLMREQE